MPHDDSPPNALALKTAAEVYRAIEGLQNKKQTVHYVNDFTWQLEFLRL
jgi:hypothetical protein